MQFSNVEIHIVRHVVTKKEKYYMCDDCNTSYPSKTMVIDDHRTIRKKIEIKEVDLRNT